MPKEYIDKSALYGKIAQLEEIARNRYLETPSNSPCYSRYMAQLIERTDFKHIIADFQAADVAPVVHGRWIEQEKYTFGVMYDCSICDNRILDNGHSWNYCPNCGAKMDKGQTEK